MICLCIMDLQKIKAGIENSRVLSPEDKKIFSVLAPFMQEADLLKLQEALDYEQLLFANQDVIGEEMKKQAADLFNAIVQSQKIYSKQTFQNEETKLQNADFSQIEQVVNNL